MAGDLSDKVGVLYLFVKVANQDAAGHVGRGNFPDGMFLLFAGDGVQRRHHAVNAGKFDHLLDIAVVVLLTNKGKKTSVGLVLIAIQNLQCGGRERYPDRIGTTLLCLTRNILDRPIDDIVLGHLHQVADAASDKALEDEDVALDIQPGVIREFGLVQLVPFFFCEIEGSAIDGRADDIIIVGVPVHVASLDRPADESVETGHRSDDGILAPLLWESAFRDRFVGFFIEGILDAGFSVLAFHNKLVFIFQELGDLPEQIRGQRSKAHLLGAIDGEALQSTDNDIVVTDPGDGNLLDGYEMLERIEELLLGIILLLGRFILLRIFHSREVQALDRPIKQLLRYPFVGKGNLSGSLCDKGIEQESGYRIQLGVQVLELLDLLPLIFGHHTDLGNHEPLPVLIPVVRMSV